MAFLKVIHNKLRNIINWKKNKKSTLHINWVNTEKEIVARYQGWEEVHAEETKCKIWFVRTYCPNVFWVYLNKIDNNVSFHQLFRVVLLFISTFMSRCISSIKVLFNHNKQRIRTVGVHFIKTFMKIVHGRTWIINKVLWAY